MKRVLIIIANYYPTPSSVANCMKPLISSLSKVCNVDILTNRKRVDIPEYEKSDNTHIHRVDDYRAMATMHLNELNSINASVLLRGITKILSIFLKVIYYLRYSLFSKERITGGWDEKRVYQKFQELDEKHKYDLMISVSLPFQSHYIAEKIKDSKGDNIKWVVFEFDPFAFNDVIKVNKRLREKMHSDEKRILEKCDGICLTPELFSFYKKEKFIEFSSKVNELAFANLEPIEYDPDKVTENFMKEQKINCLFTGQLYDDIRNPSKLLSLFSKMDKDIHLSMMTNWSVEKIRQHSPENYHPSVIHFQNRDTALYNLTQADILVNIGNTVELQVPGKIFEYMSTGKPIIHLSKMSNDPVLKYLNHYPKVFIVNEWEIGTKNYEKELEMFCKDNRYYQLEFEEINESLGEYSGDRVLEKFFSILDEVLGEKINQ